MMMSDSFHYIMVQVHAQRFLLTYFYFQNLLESYFYSTPLTVFVPSIPLLRTNMPRQVPCFVKTYFATTTILITE